MERLSEVFRSLQPMPDGQDLAAMPLPGGSRHRIAKTADGRPILLFYTPNDADAQLPPPTRLANIRTTFGRPVRLTAPAGAESGCFACIELVLDEKDLYPVFLDALQPVAERIPGPTTASQLVPLLDRVHQLFRSLGGEPRNTALGAWGELLAMEQLAPSTELAAMWHSHPEDLVDFSAPGFWLEVKTTTGSSRRHQVQERQVTPPGPTAGFLVSILTAGSGAGLTLRELAARLRATLSEAGQTKFDGVLAAQLGRDYANSLAAAFDETLGRTSLQVYDMKTLPRVPSGTPPEISDMRYVLDLSGQPPAGPAKVRDLLKRQRA